MIFEWEKLIFPAIESTKIIGKNEENNNLEKMNEFQRLLWKEERISMAAAKIEFQ